MCFSVVKRCQNAWLTRDPRGSAGDSRGSDRMRQECLVARDGEARNENTASTSDTTLCSLYQIHIRTTYSLCTLRSFESEIRFLAKGHSVFLSSGCCASFTQLCQPSDDNCVFAVELHESPHSVLTLQTSASSNHIFCCGAAQITFLKTHPQFHHPSRLRYQGRHLPPTTFQLRPRDVLLPMRPPRLKFL